MTWREYFVMALGAAFVALVVYMVVYRLRHPERFNGGETRL